MSSFSTTLLILHSFTLLHSRERRQAETRVKLLRKICFEQSAYLRRKAWPMDTLSLQERLESSEWFPEKEYLAQKTWLQSTCARILTCGPIPKHVAFIMDGNRRFATKSSIDREEGHVKGFDKLAETLQWCLDLGITEVTVYAFSIENFKRSREEVDGLMELAKQKFVRLVKEKDEIMKHGLCIRVLGNLSMLPPDLQQVVSEAVYLSRNNTRAVLNVCMAYTSREEMTNAIRELSWGVQQDLLLPSDVSEDLMEKCFYTRHSKDPDLLVRTSGEVRLSDFLLWQSGFTVLSFVNVLWPEFTIWHLFGAVLQYQMNYSAVKAAKDASELRRKQAVHNSDYNQVIQSMGDTHSLTRKMEEYAKNRDHRIQRFLHQLEHRKCKELIDMLPKELREAEQLSAS